jgi:hypothetical protein
MRSELNAVNGQGSGNVIVTLTGRDKPNLHAELEFNVRDMPPNSTFAVQRKFDPNPDGQCTGIEWVTLGSITTSEGGAGAAHFATDRRAPFVSGFRFDIQYRVVGNGTELQSECLTLTVK